MKRIGLIINPVAGLGGRVGLKGSDGLDIQRQALQAAAQPQAGERAVLALHSLVHLAQGFELLTSPGEMGAEAALQVGLPARVVGSIQPGHTVAEDTIRIARLMAAEQVDLLLFTGGDGTARDICTAIGMELPALGIPAGVKIHSAVYATHARAAGELAAAFLRAECKLRLGEVMDLAEGIVPSGRLTPQLFGYLKIPYNQRYVQGSKAPSLMSEPALMEAIAENLRSQLRPGWLSIIGPGSTTQAVALCLGVEKDLLGVAAFQDGMIVQADASEKDLLELLAGDHPAEIIITPIGGQGCLLGRGNQPISPLVIRKVGREHIHVVSSPGKIQALNGRPFWVDTGDWLLDQELAGYYEVITGYKETVMYKVSA